MNTIKILKLNVSLIMFLVLIFMTVEGLANAPDKENRDPIYVPGEMIIKFKDDAVVGQVADELINESGSTFQDVAENDVLDKLNKKHKVKAFKRVFQEDENVKAQRKALKKSLKGKFNRAVAQKLHKKAREDHQGRAKRIRAKRDGLAEKRGKSKTAANQGETKVPYLGSVYKVEMGAEQDIEKTCAEYLNDPNVEFCQPNYAMQINWVPNDRYFSTRNSWRQVYDDLWGLKKIGMTGAWDISKGAGTVVAVVDTGVDYTHSDISANIWRNADEIANNGIDDDNNGFIDDIRGWDFFNNDNNPIDDHGHGTHCAGTIAAVGNNSIGIIGVAPEAKIMPLKGLDLYGEGTTETLANGIRYAAENGADVISNSWGPKKPVYFNPVAELAVKYAYDLGAVVVFSAGNSEDDVIKYAPQNKINEVIVVSASSELDKRTRFSNYGSLIDVAAPGGGSSLQFEENILSLLASNSTLANASEMQSKIVGSNYLRIAGTSMACPHVAGVAALILSKHPEFTPADVKQVIRASADDIETPGFDILSGAGRVNAQKALMIHSVPKVKILDPLFPIDLSKSRTVTIIGNASGASFMKYQLFYAPFDSDLVNHGFDTKTWTPLGPESFQKVDAGALGTFDAGLFLNQYYLLKLEVTDIAGKKYSDIREIIAHQQESPRLTQIESVDNYQSFSYSPLSSEKDTFVWIKDEIIPKQPKYNPPFGGIQMEGVVKIYHGPSNKSLSIYSGDWNTYYEFANPDIGISRVFLSPKYVVWQEQDNCVLQNGSTSYDCEKVIKIATISDLGEINVIREKRIPRFEYMYIADVNNDRILFQTYTHAVIHDIVKNSDTSIPFGSDHSTDLSLSGNSLAYVKDYQELRLYDLLTKSSIFIQTVDFPFDSNFKNTPNSLSWVRTVDDASGQQKSLWTYNKKTAKFTKIAISDSWQYSFKNDKMAFINRPSPTSFHIYSDSLLDSEGPELLTSYFLKDINGFLISAGDHIAFFKKNIYAQSFGWVVFNDPPVFKGLIDQKVLVNQPYTLTVKAVDPESDKINIMATGGTWPNQTTSLPSGARFTDNGDGTATFIWTPTNLGIQKISFLARDFAGRKDNTWNRSKTVNLNVVQACPALSASATVSPQTGDFPLDSKFTISLGEICGNWQYTFSVDFGDGVISPWTAIREPISLNHRYERPGSYTAKVLVKNNLGEQIVVPKTIQVKPAPLSASVSVSRTVGYLPIDAIFSITVQNSPYTTYTTSVDFGDGAVSPWKSVTGSTSVTHRYARVGRFLAKVYVKDNYGQQVILNKTITVNPYPLSVTAQFPSLGTVTGLYRFEVYIQDRPYTSYTVRINYGDGNIRSSASPGGTTVFNYAYTIPGDYRALVTVTDNHGQTFNITSDWITMLPIDLTYPQN